MKPNSKYIFYFDRQKVVVLGTALAQGLVLDLPQNIFSDIEVVDLDSFERFLGGWFEQNNILPQDTILIFSPQTYFETTSPLIADPNQLKQQLENYSASIPFDNVFTKSIPLENNLKFVALNRAFFEPIVDFFNHRQFNILAILPIFILEKFQLGLAEFTSKEALAIYQQIKPLSAYSLMSTQEIDKSFSETKHLPPEDRRRTYLLVGVFCSLWIILLIVLFARNFSTRPPAPTPALIHKVSVTPTTIPVVSP